MEADRKDRVAIGEPIPDLEVEVVYDYGDDAGPKPVMLVPTAAVRKKLAAAGLAPGKKLKLTMAVVEG